MTQHSHTDVNGVRWLHDHPIESADHGHAPRIGVPVTVEQACRAILSMIDSPVMGDASLDASPGTTLQRLQKPHVEADGATAYDMLSRGERLLVDITTAIWRGPAEEGARISALGGLDRTLRRKVLMVLWYFYLGHDIPIELDPDEWTSLFGQWAVQR